MKKPKLIFLTGAGISAESGLQTFRDSKDGLWNNFKIEEVCSTQAWEKNPELVLNFIMKDVKNV
jgi:NAD-dependent deacetylase